MFAEGEFWKLFCLTWQMTCLREGFDWEQHGGGVGGNYEYSENTARIIL